MTTAADTLANDLLQTGVLLNRVAVAGMAPPVKPIRECTVEQILDRIEAEKHPAIRRMMAQMLYDRGRDDAMNAIRPRSWQKQVAK